jgi:glucosamine kinase
MGKGLVIGEVGGSSSRWAWVSADEENLLPPKGEGLPGFNPLSSDADAFVAEAKDRFAVLCPAMLEADRVEVYGAGCGDPARRDDMRAAIARIWPQADVQVHTDLLGAARGLTGGGAGLVIILGTGMNAGYFEGTQLHCPMPSLGFILGDEGSGADIGRHLLQDAFYRRMPEDVRDMLFGREGPDLAAVLQAVHRGPTPARSLASYTADLVPLLHEPYVRELLLSRFHAFAELLVSFFPVEQRREVYATGSVAWGFRELLGECLLDRGMTLIALERDPLPGLVRFHR